MSDEDLWTAINNRSHQQRKQRAGNGVGEGFLAHSQYFKMREVQGSLSGRLEYEADSRRDAANSVEYDRQGDNPNLARGSRFPDLSVWRNPVLDQYSIERCYHCPEGQISLSVEKTLKESGIEPSDSLYDIIRQGLEAEKMHPDNLAAAEKFMESYREKFPGDLTAKLTSSFISSSVATSNTISSTISSGSGQYVASPNVPPEKPDWM